MVRPSRPGTGLTGRPRRLALAAIGLTWLVLAATVGLGAYRLRVQVREQILGRDGEILMAYARTLQEQELDEVLAEDPLAVLVAMARLNGIFASRLFETDGRFVWSMPATLDDEDAVPPSILERVRDGATVGRYLADFSPAALSMSTNLTFWLAATNAYPAVEVWVPLRDRSGLEFKGVASFILDGVGVAREFARLDRRLLLETSLILAAGFLATGGAIGWAFRQLAESHRLLARRTDALQQANRELARSARVTALGAVTAHLIHGLRNPMSGLRSFVEAPSEPGGPDEVARADARAAAGRMQALIEQVVRLLREEASDLSYEVTLHEVGEAVAARVRPRAEARGVRLALEGDPPGQMDNRRSGLLAMIVTNLMENAVEATPAGGTVRIRMQSAGGPGEGWVLDVVDAGPGLPEGIRDRLFQPLPSTKEGGSGLGLVITRQLTLALGGRVSLLSTGPDGSTFRVELPGTDAGSASPPRDDAGPSHEGSAAGANA